MASSTPALHRHMRMLRTFSLLIFCLCETNLTPIVQGDDNAGKWTVTIHKNGEETNRVILPSSSKLNQEIDELKKHCSGKATIDRNSYAPSVRIDSELERIDLRAKAVVYSTRKSVDDSWQQRSLRTGDNYRELRRQLIAFAKERLSD